MIYKETGTAPEYPPAAMNVALKYFHRKIEEKLRIKRNP